jgi:uracil-DNA glycosylase family 4
MRQSGLFHIIGDQVVDRVCTSCELSYCAKLKTNCMPGIGCRGAIMFVGKHPGREDDQIGEPMTGKNGKLFYGLLLDAGFSREDIYVTNCVKCAPISGNATKRNWQACSQHFKHELEMIKPVMIIAVGAEATEFLTGRKGVTSLRATGLACEIDDSYTVYPIRQPMAIEHAQTQADKTALRESMVEDLRRILRIYRNGGKVSVDEVQDTTDYRIARTHEDVVAFFEELRAFKGPISCDLETVNHEWTDGALHPDDGKILAIGFSTGEGTGRAIPVNAKGTDSLFWWPDGYVDDVLIKQFIVPFLRERHRDIYGHNWCKFDTKWTRSHWGVDFPELQFDTILGAYAAFHGLRSYDLEVLANSMCGMARWKREFTVQDTEALCKYLCKDVDAQVRLRNKIEKALDDKERTLLEMILMPCAYELMLMEERGTMIDPEALEQLGHDLSAKREAVLTRIMENEDVRKWRYNHGMAFNPGSPDHVRDILFNQMGIKGIKKTDSKQWSTDATVMEALKEQVPLCADIVEFKRIDKLYGTYYVGIKERLRNGVIHTSIHLHRAATGRTASSDPNLQNIPREDTLEKAGFAKEDAAMMKNIFVARPGFTLLQDDYSQIELRVLAALSGDKNMTQMFLDNKDIHRATAAFANEIAEEEVNKAQRTAAKKINFGVPYGKTLQGLKADFVAMGSTEEMAQLFWDKHHEMFPTVWEYMGEQERQVLQNGETHTWFGRTRVYENKGAAEVRQGMNNEIQSSASDLTLISIIRIGRELRRRGMKSRILLTVHDSIIFEVYIDEFWDVCELTKGLMEDVRLPWITVPIIADLQAGPRWGTLFSVDLKNRSLALEK